MLKNKTLPLPQVTKPTFLQLLKNPIKKVKRQKKKLKTNETPKNDVKPQMSKLDVKSDLSKCIKRAKRFKKTEYIHSKDDVRKREQSQEGRHIKLVDVFKTMLDKTKWRIGGS